MEFTKEQFVEGVAEASTLGIGPGGWPHEITIDGQEFVVSKFNSPAPVYELESVTYRNIKTGEKVSILND